MSLVTCTVGALLAVAVGLCLVCAVGALSMRDPLQRLHYLSPPASLAAFLLVAAVLIVDHHDWQAAAKTLLIALLLTAINAVVGHATARAALRHMAARRLKQAASQVPRVDLEGREVGHVPLGGPPYAPQDLSRWT